MARTQAFHFLKRHSGLVALVGAVLLSLAAVAAADVIPAGASDSTHDREIVLKAQKFSYSPGRVSVNRGDHVVMRLDPQDVAHGLYLDGYGLETHAMPTDVGVLEFTANEPGMYRFRCSVTCGPLHPFMVGELNVESGTPHTNVIFLGAAASAALIAVGSVVFVWKRGEGSDGNAR